MAAELSDLPKTPDELEDFVAALFQASGHFVEKNIRGDELELDRRDADDNVDSPLVTLVEVSRAAVGVTRSCSNSSVGCAICGWPTAPSFAVRWRRTRT